jgi:hypothetical protein
MHAHHTTYQEGISGGSILRCHLPCKGVNFRLPKPQESRSFETGNITGRRIILVHGIRKKTRALPVRDLQVALERRKDWLARNPA